MTQPFNFWVYILKVKKIILQKDICTSMFIAALFTIANLWTNLSIQQQVNGILLSH